MTATKYAIVNIKGRQFKVSEGETIQANLIEADSGTSLSFDEVLFIKDGSSVKVGTPRLSGAKVTATVVEHTRGEKALVFKYLRKNRHKTLKGHKQPYTLLKITAIQG